ncbi:hypothetical protein OF83DRAFT_1088508 [Amylostereum chailletii]|nr:hypothetical protein OF83DRAFT_1088508 [Amylostereum chailletii]
MLALRRCPRAACSLPASARHLSQTPAFPDASDAPNDAPPPRAPEPGHSENPGTRRGPKPRGRKALTGAEKDALERTAFVSPWTPPRSVVDSFSYAQFLEQTYGPLKEIVVPRDPDYLAYALPYFWATFVDASTRATVPDRGEVLTTAVSSDPPPWGPGLSDLQGLTSWRSSASAFDPPAFESASESPAPSESSTPSESQSVNIRVEPAKVMPQIRVNRQHGIATERKRYEFAEAWLRWGGFASGAEAPRPHLDRVTQAWAAEVDRLAPKYADSRAATDGADAADADAEVEAARAEDEVKAEHAAAANAPLQREFVLADVPLAWQPLDVPAPSKLPAAAASSSRAQSQSPSASSPKPASTAPLSRRERLLQATREHARAPLPASALPDAAARADAEQKEAQRQSIKDRLWRLMGGRGFDS